MTDRGTTTRIPDPWIQDAACADYDPEAWFPHLKAHTATMRRDNLPSDIRRPMQVCLACPVRTECLQDALDYRDGDREGREYLRILTGIRGGVVFADAGRIGDPYGLYAAELRRRERAAAGREAADR